MLMADPETIYNWRRLDDRTFNGLFSAGKEKRD
jgi:hypothetical protein